MSNTNGELVAVVSGFGGYQTHRLYETVTENQPAVYTVDSETIETSTTETTTVTTRTETTKDFATSAEAWRYITNSLGFDIK